MGADDVCQVTYIVERFNPHAAASNGWQQVSLNFPTSAKARDYARHLLMNHLSASARIVKIHIHKTRTVLDQTADIEGVSHGHE
jgi:hypothetical protein